MRRTSLRRLASSATPACCYAVLEIAPTATPVQIKRAFYAQARKLHPDIGGESAENHFVRAVLAYETLMDPSLRRVHDEDRRRASTLRESGSSRGAAYRRGRRRPQRQGRAAHPRWRAEEGDEKYSHADSSIAAVDERLFVSLDRAMLHAFEGPDELASVAELNAMPRAAAAALLGDAPPPAFPWAFELDEHPLAREQTAGRVEVLTMVVGRTTLGRVTVVKGGALELQYGGAIIARAARCDKAQSIRIDFAVDEASGESRSFTIDGVVPSPGFGQDAVTTHAASSRDTMMLSHRTPLVRHHHWLRGGSTCEARATRNTLPPSKWWLFAPRDGAQLVRNSWYVELARPPVRVWVERLTAGGEQSTTIDADVSRPSAAWSWHGQHDASWAGPDGNSQTEEVSLVYLPLHFVRLLLTIFDSPPIHRMSLSFSGRRTRRILQRLF